MAIPKSLNRCWRRSHNLSQDRIALINVISRVSFTSALPQLQTDCSLATNGVLGQKQKNSAPISELAVEAPISTRSAARTEPLKCLGGQLHS